MHGEDVGCTLCTSRSSCIAAPHMGCSCSPQPRRSIWAKHTARALCCPSAPPWCPTMSPCHPRCQHTLGMAPHACGGGSGPCSTAGSPWGPLHGMHPCVPTLSHVPMAAMPEPRITAAPALGAQPCSQRGVYSVHLLTELKGMAGCCFLHFLHGLSRAMIFVNSIYSCLPVCCCNKSNGTIEQTYRGCRANTYNHQKVWWQQQHSAAAIHEDHHSLPVVPYIMDKVSGRAGFGFQAS